MNKQFSKNEQAISKSHQVKNPLKSLQLDSTKIYKLKQEDLDKFNDHIDYLSDKVEGEVKRTQENNQYDIDRINTFLAIGIGLLAIIGGLLPLVINFFSRESLDKRMDSIQEEAKEIQTASNAAKLAAEGANEKAKTASDTVSGLDSKVKDAEKSIEEVKEAIAPLKDGLKEVKEATRKIPYIDLLVFQNAVAKLTSTDALKLFIGASRYTDVATYLQNLIAAIDSFDNDLFENNTDFDVKYFKNVVIELKLALRMGPIRRIPDGRSFQEKIDEVVLQLTKLEKMETKDFKEQLKTVSTSLTELKVLVENKATV
jgi:archaellum component FlaC